MPSGQGLAICVIAMNCIFLAMAKAMELTPDQERTPEMLDQDIIDGIIAGESFITAVADSDDNFIYVEEIDGNIGYDMRVKAWKEYLNDWFTNHAALIEKVLTIYEAEECGAWGFGIDVAHSVLRTGLSFHDRPFLDALLIDELDDSLQDEKTDDGVNEFWLENGQLHVG